MKTIDKKRFSILLRKVERETSNNCHSEALKMIADFFGYPEYSKLFGEYANKESITTDEYRERYESSERMIAIIRMEYGPVVSTKLNKVM